MDCVIFCCTSQCLMLCYKAPSMCVVPYTCTCTWCFQMQAKDFKIISFNMYLGQFPRRFKFCIIYNVFLIVIKMPCVWITRISVPLALPFLPYPLRRYRYVKLMYLSCLIGANDVPHTLYIELDTVCQNHWRETTGKMCINFAQRSYLNMWRFWTSWGIGHGNTKLYFLLEKWCGMKWWK